jgi:hypothetical protein
VNASDQNVNTDPTPIWDETNGWRQGSVLPQETAVALGLIEPNNQTQFAMVISHDCDCAADPDREPLLEIVIGSCITKLNGSLTFSKSTRKLHLSLSECNQLVELQISSSQKISKEAIAAIRPNRNWSLTHDEKVVLAQWLAARYNRASFPTALVNRLRPVEDDFRETAKKYADAAVGIFVDFDPEGELLDDLAEPYMLRFSIVFDERMTSAEENCLQLCRELETVFSEAYRNEADGVWTSIELEACVAIADTQFTYRDSRTSRLYRLDDVSLRSAPQGPLPSAQT